MYMFYTTFLFLFPFCFCALRGYPSFRYYSHAHGSLSLLSKENVKWRSEMASYMLLFYLFDVSTFCQPCSSVVCLNFLLLLPIHDG
jgi:hypothetical protein